jgi:hypothetical protein
MNKVFVNVLLSGSPFVRRIICPLLIPSSYFSLLSPSPLAAMFSDWGDSSSSSASI